MYVLLYIYIQVVVEINFRILSCKVAVVGNRFFFSLLSITFRRRQRSVD